MTGLEKILAEIKTEANAAAEQTIAAANAKAEKLLAAAKADADAKAAKEAQITEQKKLELEQSSKSATALQRQQHVLAQKRTLLDETLRKAKESLYNLPEDEYFSLLIKLAAKSVHDGKGLLHLNTKDLSRLSTDFKAQLEAALPPECSLELSTQSRSVDGGFVLAYGDVEENCSFAAIFDSRADEFSDLICNTLFA